MIIEPPSVDYSTYEDALRLRLECQKLGANPSTGVIKDVAERCAIYRQRIEERKNILKNSAAAKIRNEFHFIIHNNERQQIENLSLKIIEKQICDACNNNDYNKIIKYARKGKNMNIESSRGITPLLCMFINKAPLEYIEELLSRQINVNYCNKFGLTPLMFVCLLREAKLIHKLVQYGAQIEMKMSNDLGDGNTALHICAIHGCEEEIK